MSGAGLLERMRHRNSTVTHPLLSASVAVVTLLCATAAPVRMAQAQTSLVPQQPLAPAGNAAPAPPPVVASSTSRAAPAVPAVPPALEALPSVGVRGGEHGAFDRLVFDWPRTVGSVVARDGTHATVTFDRSAHINEAGLRAQLPADMTLAGIHVGAHSTEVVFTLPPGGNLRLSTLGSRVVVDMVRGPKPAPGEKPAPAEIASASPQPSAPAAPAPAPKSALSAPVAKPASPVAAAPSAQGTDVIPSTTSAPAAPASSASAAPSGSYSLSFSWDTPVGAAVFRRAGYLWVVFDHHQDVDVNLMKREGGDALSFVEQLPATATTQIRMIVSPSYQPSIRRENALWIVDLSGRPTPPPATPIGIMAPAPTAEGNGIALDVADPGIPVQITDPEVGDQMTVVPVVTFGAAVATGRATPGVDVLPTVQGIALIPHVDDLEVNQTRQSVLISEPNGLPLSNAPGAAAGAANPNGPLFDVAQWGRGGPSRFETESKNVEAQLRGLANADKPVAYLNAAQFYFANGYAPECLGDVAVAVGDDPRLNATPQVKALRGACNTLLGRWDLALPDLDDATVAKDPEAQFWRAAAHAGASLTPADWAKPLAAGIASVQKYPKALAYPVLKLVARAAIAADDDATAQMAVVQLDKLAELPIEHDWVHYLTGSFDEMTNQFDKAITEYTAAVNGTNREARARAAFALAELQLRLKKITPTEAADTLDRLRFAWRDEDYEFPLLRRIGEIQAQAGDYGSALRSWRALGETYPDNKGTPGVIQEMHDLFNKLYLDGQADTLSPVAAIGLYDEFRDLTPNGAPGDQMIAKLADRLAAVDLLDSAADLLQFQVTKRLQGLEKAKVGTRLAVIDLLDKNPANALTALSESDGPGLPDDLQAQRRHLQARTLADLGRTSDAIASLAGDTSSDAALLRAEIYWSKQDWPDAANAFSVLAPQPTPGARLADSDASMVLSWATALSLAQDQRGLATLTRQYAASLAGTSYADAFAFLTAPPDKQLVNLAQVNAKVTQAEGFRTFIANYKDEVQAGDLSKIN